MLVTPATQTLQVGSVGQASASATDASQTPIGGQTFAWSSNSPAVASVDAGGKITAVAIGSATITASVAGVSSTAAVNVIPVALRNFKVVNAQFTQGVQAPDGSIPMVLLNKPAVVNVLIARTSETTTPTMQVVLNMYDGGNHLFRSDTAVTSTQLLEAPTFATPTVQFLIPAADLQPGVRWNVIRDPKHLVTDEDPSDDAYPRSGTIALGTAIVQPLNVRFLPIRLDANGGGLSGLSLDQIPEYTRTLVSAFPLGITTFTIGQPVVTSISFGTAPNGGELAFWQAVLDDVDFARSLSAVDQSTYWMGVVIPPAGFRNSAYGGIGYLPSNGNANGDRTRSSVAIGPDWYTKPTLARDNVAHELGHNFGRSHAPCGNIGSNIDARYPTTDGTIGVSGHDVFSWAHGLSSNAPVVDAAFADVMSYCNPAWASPYTYLGILNFRNPAITSIVATLPRQRVLFVRGFITNGVDVKLEPAFTAVAYPSHPEKSGEYHLQGLAANGTELFSYYFAPAAIDHAPTIGHFTFAIPLSDSLESQLTTIRVSAANGKSAMRQASPSFAGVSALGAAGASKTAQLYSLKRMSRTT
ncbi:MAG: Ig-like domain-containing protein, partial [Gemmatimonadaceae bacterium]